MNLLQVNIKISSKYQYNLTMIRSLLMVTLLALGSCGWSSQEAKSHQTYDDKMNDAPESFGYDFHFLGQHYDDLVHLIKGDAQLVISPALQARVMTSTANGAEGKSFGWLNYELIGSGEI